MERIAEALFEALSSADPAFLESLRTEMEEYAGKYPASLRTLKRVPGFCRLWVAVKEATEYVTHAG